MAIWHFEDDGTYTVIDSTYDDGVITFSIDGLSYFSIAGVDEPCDASDDNTLLYVAAVVIIVIVLAAVLVYIRMNKDRMSG